VKVALVTSIPYGGPVEHAVLLARDLVRLGVAVSAVAADPAVAARFAAGGARAAVLPLRSPGDWAGAVRVHRFVRDADVVHSHDRRSGLWVRLGPSHGALRVHTLHGLPEPYLDEVRPGLKARLAYGGLERALAARADVLIAPSHAAARLLSDRVGYALEDIVVVPNGVDFPAEPVAPGALVGTLSAHEPVKGLEVFLAAVPLVLEARPATRFVIYGTGSLEAELRERARGLPVDFPGHVPAAQALRSLAVLALPSYMETSGLALLEAMAAGIPAVASRVGGIEETAPAGAATLVEPGDPAALAQAIGALLEDPSAQIAAGRSAAAERTATRTAERMLDVYLRRS
jgi:glycosyltransferase involved in cell wall biosynthesis